MRKSFAAGLLLLLLFTLSLIAAFGYSKFWPNITKHEPFATPTIEPNGISTKTGIQGKALIGPTCPVSTPTNPCGDKPDEGLEVKVENSAGKILKILITKFDGSFRVQIPPGNYKLVYELPGPIPKILATKEVIVESGKLTDVVIEIDSGIR